MLGVRNQTKESDYRFLPPKKHPEKRTQTHKKELQCTEIKFHNGESRGDIMTTQRRDERTGMRPER